MVDETPHKRRTAVPISLSLLVVLLLAAALRWSAPDLVYYTYDEADQVARATGLTVRDGLARFLGGGTQVGLERSALHAWLLSLPLAAGGGRVEAAIWWMGALGVVAVALGYRLGAAVGGPCCGVLTALFLAANPWIVQGDRRLWAHVYLVLSVAIPWLAWEALVQRHRRALIALPIVAVLQLMTHLIALLQALSWPVALIMTPRAWLRRAFALGLLAAGLLLAPYAWALLAQTDWDALQAPALSRDAPKLHWEALTSSHTWPPLLRLTSGLPVTRRAIFSGEWGWAVALLFALTGIGLLRLLRDAFDRQRGVGARLILFWPVLPLLVLALRPLPVHEQYWTVLTPFPALFAALGLDQVRRLLPGPGVRATVTVLIALVITAVWLPIHAAELTAFAQGERGTTLRFWRAVVDNATDQAHADNLNSVRFIVNGRDPAVNGEAAAVATLLGTSARAQGTAPLFARFVEASRPPGLLLAQAEPSLHMVLSDASAQESALAQMGDLVWSRVPQGAHGMARLYRTPAYDPNQLGVTPLVPAPRFDAGLQLVGTRLPAARADQAATYTLVWAVFAQTPDATTRALTAFNHILDADGGMAAQTDGLSLLSRDWWTGDLLVQSYSLTLPAGDYTWRAGLYSLLDGGRAYLLEGLEQGEWIDHVDIPFTVAP